MPILEQEERELIGCIATDQTVNSAEQSKEVVIAKSIVRQIQMSWGCSYLANSLAETRRQPICMSSFCAMSQPSSISTLQVSLLQRDETGRVRSTDTRTTVLDRLAASHVSNHLHE
jgi:hypothetical protein